VRDVFACPVARCASSFQFRHSGIGGLFAACRHRVAFDLLQGLVSRDRHDLVRRRSGFSQGRRGSFANTVGRAMRKIRLATPVLELVPEAVGREGFAKLREQEGQLHFDLGSSDTVRQFRMQRNIDVDRIAVFVLCLSEADSVVPNVLAAEAGSIFAPARCVTQQVQGESRLRTNRMSPVKLFNLFVGPGVMPVGPIFQLFHPDGGIDCRSSASLAQENNARSAFRS